MRTRLTEMLGIKIVETAGRNPEPFLPPCKAAGITVIHKCTSIRHSLKAERIIAERLAALTGDRDSEPAGGKAANESA